MQNQVFDYKKFKAEGEKFFAGLVKGLGQQGLSADAYVSDHLCFRVENQEQYEFYRNELLKHGKLLTEALVNGRPICTFDLFEGFQTESYEIKLVELPAPKPGSAYTLGFEHAEFILPEGFDNFVSQYPTLKFSLGGNKSTNPELCIKLENGQVKFHPLSLKRVIEIEQAKIKDIIFDFDGTLIKSREQIYEVNRIVFSEALDRDVSLQEVKDNFHTEFSKLFDAFQVTCTVKRTQAVDSWGEVSKRFDYELFDGAKEMLLRLKNLNFRLHLWTARDESSATKILQAHGIEDLFETLSFATDVDSKPHASSLRFDWAGAAKDSVVLIGDSSTDMRGAQNVGAVAAAALWDHHVVKSSVVSAGAELFFDELGDFEKWVQASAQG